MLGKHPFKVGQRVRPSPQGIEAHIFDGTYRGQPKAKRSGVVTSVDRFNSPMVRWDGLKHPHGYAPWFIEPDKRRRG